MEQKARRHLEAAGLHFREANYTCRMGEIDLIMLDQHTLVFVEVRYREHSDFCNPLETVTRTKQRKLIKAASHYLLTRIKSHDVPCRFDVVGITSANNEQLRIEWIKNAFY
ncbi:MAG: YraN family protein [Ketobacteraceae bacterium]|nr:YraN family protein [Ketobacteraceae bacterium]